MSVFEDLERLEKRVNKLTEQKASEEEKSEEDKMFELLSDDETIEAFLESILSTLGELEQAGKISKMETPEQTRAAMIAAVRRMYQKRGLIAKMSRIYNRFGAKRILQRARRDISKALT